MPTIKLQSSNGEDFDVDVRFLKCSGIMKGLLEDGDKEDKKKEPLVLPKVNSEILRLVLIWAEYHKDDPEPPEDEAAYGRSTDDIIPWDIEFLKMEQRIVIELMMAADYMDIKGLLQLIAKHLANMMKGKTPQQIRQIFNIPRSEIPKGPMK
ncbi:S-phase kinase-associated protein 1-like [Drosophila pseudoobscura]|uniref:S-phase kinase-associated protein 1-like n=1 Tax=Drosophila pseudoobscura pseudoobscura TaxID=46245 RepID=A0A0R3P8P8_DROPS|nr:S-phase kinase-associated protein 1-like [Drosophila pseudoobscura]